MQVKAYSKTYSTTVRSGAEPPTSRDEVLKLIVQLLGGGPNHRPLGTKEVGSIPLKLLFLKVIKILH